jgi:hypothetical protein
MAGKGILGEVIDGALKVFNRLPVPVQNDLRRRGLAWIEKVEKENNDRRPDGSMRRKSTATEIAHNKTCGHCESFRPEPIQPCHDGKFHDLCSPPTDLGLYECAADDAACKVFKIRG